MLKNVDRILVRVHAVAAAVDYYQRVLGLELVRHDGKVALFKIGGSGTEMVLHSDREMPDQAFYYRVDDVRAIYARREALRLKFTVPPRQVARGYTATCRDPFGQVLLLIDRAVEEPVGEPHVERVRGADEERGPGLFGAVEVRKPVKSVELAEIYRRIGRTADDLPYTPQFEALYVAYSELFGEQRPARREVWRHLLTQRKKAALPKLGKAKSTPPPIKPEERQLLIELIGHQMGKRDRLPYTPEFDAIVNDFNKTQTRKMSPHLVWRLVATLAK